MIEFIFIYGGSYITDNKEQHPSNLFHFTGFYLRPNLFRNNLY